MGTRVRAGLQDVLEAVADQIRNVLEAVDAVDVQVEPRMVLNPSPLTVDVYPGDPSRDEDSAAFDEVSGGYLLTVRSRIHTADFDAAYDLLIALMDDEDGLSLANALLDDPTLNGWAAAIDVRNFSGLRAYEHPSGEGAHLGFQFTVLAIPGES